ncbi:MAG TPA: hypothetical protein VN496_04405 [Burkholderiales bacterium]|jgi:hypothetical protein|nr:hypothetical protein [Burkholderiales bacterium]
MVKTPAVVAFISREDYADFRAVCVDGDSMPGDYKVFLKTYNEEIGAMRASGVSPTQMNIKPGELARWCKAKGLAVDAKGRTAYADFIFGGLNIKRSG